MGIVHIAEGFKNSGLVVLSRKLIVHILKFNAPAPAYVIQSAQAIRVHLPEG